MSANLEKSLIEAKQLLRNPKLKLQRNLSTDIYLNLRKFKNTNSVDNLLQAQTEIQQIKQSFIGSPIPQLDSIKDEISEQLNELCAEGQEFNEDLIICDKLINEELMIFSQIHDQLQNFEAQDLIVVDKNIPQTPKITFEIFDQQTPVQSQEVDQIQESLSCTPENIVESVQESIEINEEEITYNTVQAAVKEESVLDEQTQNLAEENKDVLYIDQQQEVIIAQINQQESQFDKNKEYEQEHSIIPQVDQQFLQDEVVTNQQIEQLKYDNQQEAEFEPQVEVIVTNSIITKESNSQKESEIEIIKEQPQIEENYELVKQQQEINLQLTSQTIPQKQPSPNHLKKLEIEPAKLEKEEIEPEQPISAPEQQISTPEPPLLTFIKTHKLLTILTLAALYYIFE